MADNQKAKHGDSQSGQKNDQDKNKGQHGQVKQEGNQDSRFGQGGEGDQKQGDRGQNQGQGSSQKGGGRS